MDLIEKASRKMAEDQKSSLIERAARRLAGEQVETQPTGSVEPPPPPVEPTPTVVPEPPPLAPTPAVPPAAPAPPPPAAGSAPAGAGMEAVAPAPKPVRRVFIDLDRLYAEGMVTPRGERTRTAEEFRMIKRPLLLKALAKDAGGVENGNLIMVSSAVPEEGKTFTAVNLAMSIAKERDLYILLVDADLSRPNVASTLGIETDRGFVDVLEDTSFDVSEVLARTNVENFSIIPAGRPHPMGTELLASERAAQVIGEISHRYSNRIIIFDTAPVLASSEWGVLARFVGQAVFVVEAEKTPSAAVKGALEVLGPSKNVGLVLNKSRSSLAGSRFGGYYSYYYKDEGY